MTEKIFPKEIAESSRSDDIQNEINGIWEGDQLERQSEADFLERFLLSRAQEIVDADQRTSFVLNIDSGWGGGKTYFMSRFKEQLEHNGYWVVYVDAWKSDHAEDPLLAVVSELDAFIETKKSVAENFREASRDVVAGLKKAVGSVVISTFKKQTTRVIGQGIEEVFDTFRERVNADGNSSQNEEIAESAAQKLVELGEAAASTLLTEHKVAISATQTFKDNLEGLVCLMEDAEDTNPPLFILIDELDRCRPTYAIEMLERIKHMFDVSGVVFLIATHKDQLSESVKAVYGKGFDGRRYLQRFFDQTYHLRDPEFGAFVANELAKWGVDEERFNIPFGISIEEYLERTAVQFDMNARDIERCIAVLRTVISVWPYDNLSIELCFLFPLIAAVQTDNWPLFDDLSNSQNHSTTDYHWDRNELAEMEVIYNLGFQSKRAKLSPMVIAQTYSQLMKDPLDVIAAIGTENSPVMQIVRLSFREEFSKLHNNAVRGGVQLYSVLRKYGDLVTTASRIEVG